jgi:hypothetical protein
MSRRPWIERPDSTVGDQECRGPKAGAYYRPDKRLGSKQRTGGSGSLQS